MTLHDYQLNMIKKLADDIEGWKPSELYVVASGRQTGKSYYYKQIRNAMYNGTNVTLGMPEPKYKFSRANWYIADFEEKYYWEVEEWCTKHFGPHPKFPDAWSRWVHKYENKIHFRDEKDYEWFVLRWS